MFEPTLQQKIYKKLKAYNSIVIARHIGADPDALSSEIGLRDAILATFPNKKVYAVGYPASKFRYLGNLDRFSEELYENSLLIVLDTPDKKRVDGVDVDRFPCTIKIDHHPFIETFCDIEWIDDKESSCAQMIMELIANTKLKMTEEVAKKLYMGLVSDTDRFLFTNTTPKTFRVVADLIEKTDIHITELYPPLYNRPLREIKFQGFIANNMEVTESGFASIKITEDILEEYHVDVATGGNLVNNFNFIEEVIAWGIFTYDKNNNLIRGSIRSRGPIINETVSHFGGGGHIFASGVKLESFDDVDDLIDELDHVCEVYQESLRPKKEVEEAIDEPVEPVKEEPDLKTDAFIEGTENIIEEQMEEK